MAHKQDKAITHIVPLGRKIDFSNLNEKEIADELTNKLLSGEIVIPDLVRGDAIRIKSFPESPDGWYRNEGLFLVDDGIVPLDNKIDEYGHVPENLFYPEFPIDYWFDTVEHNNLVPVRFNGFQPDDVKIFPLRPAWMEGLKEPIQVPYVETEDFMIIVQVPEGDVDINQEQIAYTINHARHVDVVTEGMEITSYNHDVEWEAEYDDFKTNKPILVVIPENVYRDYEEEDNEE